MSKTQWVETPPIEPTTALDRFIYHSQSILAQVHKAADLASKRELEKTNNSTSELPQKSQGMIGTFLRYLKEKILSGPQEESINNHTQQAPD